MVVKLLVTVVRHHRGVHFVGNHQDESVTATQRTCRRCHQLAVGDCLGELGSFLFVDAMSKTRIHYHRDLGLGIFLHECEHGFIQLLQTRSTTAFGGKVASIHHHVTRNRSGSDFRFAHYHVANVESIKSASSWSCTAFEPVAGLPDSTRATCLKS